MCDDGIGIDTLKYQTRKKKLKRNLQARIKS